MLKAPRRQQIWRQVGVAISRLPGAIGRARRYARALSKPDSLKIRIPLGFGLVLTNRGVTGHIGAHMGVAELRGHLNQALPLLRSLYLSVDSKCGAKNRPKKRHLQAVLQRCLVIYVQQSEFCMKGQKRSEPRARHLEGLRRQRSERAHICNCCRKSCMRLPVCLGYQLPFPPIF
jgi:hypothetical protein